MTITLLLVIITAVISYLAFQKPELKSKFIFNAHHIYHRKEYYRLLSSGFIHADIMHLLLNMWALYMFGSMVEEYFGFMFGAKQIVYFLGLYLLGIIVSSLPDLWQQKNNVYYNSLGASGGVSSIVFCGIILNPLMKLVIFPLPIPMPAYIFAVVYVAYSVYMEKRQMNNINHMAHLWGALWGVAYILFLNFDLLASFVEKISGSF
jgi:membrane associated rhomboid family serine protease